VPGDSALGADLYLAQQIEERIACDERTAELGVRVTVRGERVYLSGTVACAERKDVVGAVAAEAARAGGRTVVNEIVVDDAGDARRAPEQAEETIA
jgi:osmotically-inducible protein OsmY